ncbi:hypothetical protein BB561_006010 [Smittium simulii]|uniref:Lysophospholipase NTE1 n=1 Tax=Smittium simulii TaxID=133385 RepID=A0A2T9Y745_9FUNG|nr:hypothetical protein BB561_006010 [Smittium simulii]
MKVKYYYNLILIWLQLFLVALILAEATKGFTNESPNQELKTLNKERLTLKKIKTELIVEKSKIQVFCIKYLSFVFSDTLIQLFLRTCELLSAVILGLLYTLLIIFRFAFSSWISSILTVVIGIVFGVFAVRTYHLPKKYKSKTPSDKRFDKNLPKDNLNPAGILDVSDIGENGLEEDEEDGKNYYKAFHEKLAFPEKKNSSSDSDEVFTHNTKKLGPSVNFLDTFLKSIQIFGYLDEAVFYELTRQLQTQRILSGERVSCVEETNDFCVIVDGLVNVYTVNPQPNYNTFQRKKNNITEKNHYNMISTQEKQNLQSSDDSSNHNLEYIYNSNTTKKLLRKVSKGNILSSLLQLLNAFMEKEGSNSQLYKAKNTQNKIGILGIAIIDTTIAVIPEKAFKRVQRKFPKVAAQIIKIILSKMQRVTLLTMQNYLNLNYEVIAFEKKISSNTFCNPHNHLADKCKFSADYFDNFLRRFKFTLLNIHQLCGQCAKESTSTLEIFNNRVSRSQSDHLKNENENNFDETLNPEDFENQVNVDENLYKIFRSKGTVILDEIIVEKLGRAYGGNILKKRIEEIKEQTESGFIKYSENDSLVKKERNIAEFTQSSNTEDNNLWPVPGINDFADLKKESIKIMSKALGLFNTSEINAKKNLKTIKLNGSFESNCSNTSSAYFSGSDAGDDYLNSRNSKPIRIFPKIEYHQLLQSETNNNTNQIRQNFEARIQYAFSELEIIYVLPGENIVTKGTHVKGIYLLLYGAVEISDNPNSNPNLNLKKKDDIKETSFDELTQNLSIIERAKSMTNIAQQVKDLLEPYTDFENIKAPKVMLKKINGTAKQHHNKLQKNNNYDNIVRSSTSDENSQSEKTFLKSLPFNRNFIPGDIIGHLSAITGVSSHITAHVVNSKSQSKDSCNGAILAFLPLSSIEKHLSKVPQLYTGIAKKISASLSSLIYHVDYSLDLKRLSGGKIVYRANSKGDNIHLILAGRLRAITDNNILGENTYSVKEYGYGDSIGEADVLGGNQRSFSLYTIRDSEFILISKNLFSILASDYPELTFHISKLIATHMLNHFDEKKSNQSTYLQLSPNKLNQLKGLYSQKKRHDSLALSTNGVSHYNTNLKTICILPVNDYVPIKEFASNLYEALIESFGYNFELLDSVKVLQSVGKNAFNKKGKLKMECWLAELEEKYRLLLYVVDSGVESKWTDICIRQADCILIVGLGDEDPSIGSYEKLVLHSKSTARKELVLLHAERTCIPGSTREWLSNRKWVYTHHHIQMPLLVRYHSNRPNTRNINSKNKNGNIIIAILNKIINKIFMIIYLFRLTNSVDNKKKNHKNGTHNDFDDTNTKNYQTRNESYKSKFDKLKSQDSNNHYDFTKATNGAILKLKMRLKSYYSKFVSKEYRYNPSPYKGYRSDFSRLGRRLCNKSVGLVMSGGGARGLALLGVLRAFEEAGIPVDMVGGTSIGAFFAGLYAQESDSVAIWRRSKSFTNHIQSFWRTFFDLTWPILSYTSGNEFNRALWKIFKDVEIEDLWLPFYCVTTNVTHSKVEVHTSGYLWKYCRASMSLSGFLPPLCDNNGQMLVDGGYLDNLPVKYMYNELGANVIFAIDIAGEADISPVYYGEAVSGLNVILNNLNPFKKFTIPNLSDIQSRLAYASSVQTLRDVKSIPGIIYAKIPPKDTGVLDFSKFNSTYKKGYYYASMWVEAWRNENKLDLWASPHKKATKFQTEHISASKKLPRGYRGTSQYFPYNKSRKYFEYFSDSNTGYENKKKLQKSIIKPPLLQKNKCCDNSSNTDTKKHVNKDLVGFKVDFYAFSD